MKQFRIRWRGREEGPYPISDIEERLRSSRIGLLHEIFTEERWMTLRDFQREQEASKRAERELLEAHQSQEREEREAEKEEAKQEKQYRAELLSEEKRRNDLLQASITGNKPADFAGGGRGQIIRSSRGGLILTLAILGLFLLAPLCVVAWVMGAGDLKEMDSGNMETSGRSSTGAGYRIGIFGTIIYAIAIIVVVIIEVYNE
jgi:hypothetical protein